jgi:hypothetical protein
MSERPLTYDHLRGKKKPNFRSVTIALDSEVADQFNSAREELDLARARLDLRPEDEKLMRALEDAEANYQAIKGTMEENAIVFKFRSIGRKQFEDLVLQHQPTKEQQDDAKKSNSGPLQWNTESFPPVLMAVSMIEPPWTAEDIKDLWENEDWSNAELMEMFYAALTANSERRVVNLGKD